MKDNLRALRKTAAAFFILCVSGPSLFGQGPLAPPAGPPGPTMKTLDQLDAKLEKRIAVNAANTPGDSEAPFVISQPGSYYLTGNLSTTQHAGIKVAAAGVTLDLNGFQLIGSSGSTGGGIVMTFPYCTVRNGYITGFGGPGITGPSSGVAEKIVVSNCERGIRVGDGWLLTDCLAADNVVGIDTGNNCKLNNCSANHNTSNLLNGISVGSNCVVTHCTSTSNGGSGIFTKDHCQVSHCNASANAGIFFFCGIVVGVGSEITDSVAGANKPTTAQADASVGGGFRLAQGSTIKNCTAEGNNGDGIQAADTCAVTGCTTNNNGLGTKGSGIATGIRASIIGCTAIGNKTDGIVFSGDSVVLNNHASTNGGAGFHEIGSASRIDGNVSRENIGTGILAATGDTVVRNNSGANGNGAANNQYGPTAGANWGPVGTANSATSPWANF